MKPRRVCALFFSPTGGTRRAALLLAEELAAQFGVCWEEFRFTTPKERDATLRFGQEDLVVAASPVYAGRLPNKLAPEFAEKLCGTHTPVVPLCVFGNRSPGDALREWLLLLEKGALSRWEPPLLPAVMPFPIGLGQGGRMRRIGRLCGRFPVLLRRNWNSLRCSLSALTGKPRSLLIIRRLKQTGLRQNFLKPSPFGWRTVIPAAGVRRCALWGASIRRRCR